MAASIRQTLNAPDGGTRALAHLGVHLQTDYSLYELTFYFLLSVWLVISVLAGSMYWFVVPGRGGKLLAAGIMLAVYLVAEWTPNVRSTIVLAGVVFLWVNGWLSGTEATTSFVVFVLAAATIDSRRTAKVCLGAICASVCFVVASYTLNLIPNVVTHRNDVLERQSLGFKFTTFLSHYLLEAFLILAWLRKDHISVVELVLFLGLDILVYALTLSRNSFLLLLAAIALSTTYKAILYHHRLGKHHPKHTSNQDFQRKPSPLQAILLFLATHSYIICATLSFAVLLCVSYQSNLGILLDGVLTRRLTYTQRGFDTYGFGLLGQEINWATRNYVPSLGRTVIGYWATKTEFIVADYNYVDCSYINVLMTQGLIAFVLIIVLLERLSLWARRREDYVLLGALCLVAIHSVLDPQLIYLDYNVFLLFLLKPDASFLGSSQAGKAAARHARMTSSALAD